MRPRRLALPAALALALLLAGCTGATPASDPDATATQTPTAAAEPKTLVELADAVRAEGLVDSATFSEITGDPGSLSIQLYWTDPPRPAEQLDVLTEIDGRIDDVLADRPEVTQISMTTARLDGTIVGIGAAYDPGAEVLLEMLETVSYSPCSFASLDTRDVGEGPRAIVTLTCKVEATDAVGLASAYDDVTDYRIDAAGIDGTRWDVSLAGRSAADGDMRLEAGPIEGRQQLFTDAMTLAVEGGADQLTLIDDGEGITIVGFADAAQAGLCTVMRERLLAAGVPFASVSLQLRDTEPGAWSCRVDS
ncbi:hypothetical protein [Herbiconiux liukaitaii]|uniref:hypothetical protein n=1 Tax=Herbiconiux liukaitaii TaxID=3342799 RepID=UPI0035B9B071